MHPRDALCALTLLLAALPAAAGELAIHHPWARASIGSSPNGAAYLAIVNGGEADRLVAVATPAAERAEIHTHEMDGGMMRMRRVEGVDAPAGQHVYFKPGGLHVMLFGLRAPLGEGGTLPLTLTFAKAGAIEVTATVLGAASMGPDEGAQGHHAEMPGAAGGMHQHGTMPAEGMRHGHDAMPAAGKPGGMQHGH